jgi:hypothetical protein
MTVERRKRNIDCPTVVEKSLSIRESLILQSLEDAYAEFVRAGDLLNECNLTVQRVRLRLERLTGGR